MIEWLGVAFHEPSEKVKFITSFCSIIVAVLIVLANHRLIKKREARALKVEKIESLYEITSELELAASRSCEAMFEINSLNDGKRATKQLRQS